MAATFNLAVGLSLLLGHHVPAHVFEAFLVVALVALIFGGSCLDSYIWLLVTAQARQANQTLPWSTGQ